jgi:hypothetical protein
MSERSFSQILRAIIVPDGKGWALNFYVAMFIGLLAAAAYGATVSWAAVLAGLLLSGAALLAGVLLGFVFGIPRQLQLEESKVVASADQASSSSVSARVRYQGNTNLEQISDWLTKILVGVGLTQFGSIASGAGRLIGNVAPAFGDGPDARVFTGGLGVFSIAFGFVTGWLYTRLLLGGAMAEADRRATARDLMEAAREAEQAGNDDDARSLRAQALNLLDGDGDGDGDGGGGGSDRGPAGHRDTARDGDSGTGPPAEDAARSRTPVP